MAVKARLASIILILLLLGGLFLRETLAQSQGDYFEETGHWVRGEFWALYNSTPNYLQLYGFPITEEFQDAMTGVQFQYFQKARFELHPGQRVRRTPLGESFLNENEARRPLPIPENSPACRTFPQTGFQVCYAFLEFFDANGGEDQFGQPISNIELLDDDRRVQYFQEARFEWQPGRPPGQRVVLTDLGYQYFFIRGEDPVLLLPVPRIEGENIAENALNLQARAYPGQAVTKAGEYQTVYVIVQDQRLMFIEGAQVTLRIHMPSGETYEHLVERPTDAKGITYSSFFVESQSIGIAEVEVLVKYGNGKRDLDAQTVTSFRIWW